MGQNLIITAIKGDHSIKVIARLICQRQSVSLQKALDIVSKPPFVFLADASLTEISKTIQQYTPLGITFKTVASQTQSEGKSEAPARIPPSDAKAQFSQSAQFTPKADPVIHHLPVDDIPESVVQTKKIPWLTIIVLILLVAGLAVLIILATRPDSKGFLSDYAGEEPTQNGSSKKKHAVSKQKNSVVDKEKSNDFADSADAHSADYEMAVNFYKMAISFNKYNYRAWYGLINTYYSMNETGKAQKAREEMIKIFGDSIFDITSIVEPFGKIQTAELRSDSSYYLEYITKASGKRALVNESYQIIRALKPTCNCVSIALFASQSAGKGLIVHIRNDIVFLSLSEFESAASFTYLE